MIRITYIKKNGDIITRYSSLYPMYKIGEINGFGWKVVNIEYQYNKKYYSRVEYDKRLNNYFKRNKVFKKLKKNFYSMFRLIRNICVLYVVYSYIVLIK